MKVKLMYDVIVIGGGLGGLTAGAKLAKSGKKVLLLEQHDRPGGCATTFQRKGFTLEVGLHEMDGLHRTDMKSRIFNDLGIFDRVEFIKVPEFYRFLNGRYDVVVTHDPDEMTNKLTKLFPNEASGIKAYYDTIMNIRQVIKKGGIDPDDTVGLFLDRIITDDDLKLILLGNLGYFHDDPYGLSLGYYCMAQNSYYTGGANFVKGGSQVLSNAIARVIEDNGGDVLLNHLATRILHKDGRAEGVEYRKKGNESSLTAYADDIVVNASIPQLGDTLLKGDQARMIRESYVGLEPGASLLTVYFGFKTSPCRMGYKHYSSFVYHPSVIRQKDIKVNNSSDYSTRSFTFVDYSQIDSGLAPAGKGVGAICCIDYIDDWEKLNPADYRKKKKLVEKIFSERLNELIPGIIDEIEYCELATAKTVKSYTLNPRGAVYGFAQTPYRAQKNVASPIGNLHYASAWTKTGGGFSGAIFSGYLTAIDVIRKQQQQ